MTVIINSANDINYVNHYKGWFCCGYGIVTFSFIPNFKPEMLHCGFLPFWIALPSIPFEYRDAKVIEILANKIGIFMRHDYIPLEHLFHMPHFCVLLKSDSIPPQILKINSKWGTWEQILMIQDVETIQKFEGKLGHISNNSKGYSDLCEDNVSVSSKCMLCQTHLTEQF